MEDPYKNLVKFYDKFVEPFSAALRKIMFKMYLPKEGMRVLEIGCGTGSNLKLYQQAGSKIYGIDLSPSMVKAANKKLGEKAYVKLGNATQLPYSDEYFDIVIAMLTLHEMPNEIRPPIVSEMTRVLKQDGRLLFVDFHPGPIQFPKGWLSKLNILLFERIAGREHFKNYRNFIANKGLPLLIEAKKLNIEKKKIVSGGNLALFSVSKSS